MEKVLRQFLEDVAAAKTLVDVNIAAGIALQALESLVKEARKEPPE